MSAQDPSTSSAPAIPIPDPIPSDPMAPPQAIYCFHCRKPQPTKDLKSVPTKFDSRKAKKPMSRDTWVGSCSVCSKTVRQFARGVKKEADPTKVEDAPDKI